MSNAQIYRRIAALLKDADDGKEMSERKASEKAGLSPDAIRNIRRKPEGTTTLATLSALARFFGRDVSYFTDSQKEIASESKGSPYGVHKLYSIPGSQKVRVIAWTEVGFPMSALPAINWDNNETTITDVAGDGLFATRLINDAMLEEGRSGDLVVFDTNDRDLVDRKLYLFLYLGELFFREYRNTNGPERFVTRPRSTGYDDIFLDDDKLITVVGRVRRVHRAYD